MRKKHDAHAYLRKRFQGVKAETTQRKPGMLYQQRATPDDQSQLPPTNDAGGGVSEATLKDASGSETGGGIDTPLHVEKRTEAIIHQEQPLHQGTSAYTGGGADNGSNL